MLGTLVLTSATAKTLLLSNCSLFSPLFEILGGKEMNHTEPESDSAAKFRKQISKGEKKKFTKMSSFRKRDCPAKGSAQFVSQ